MKIYMYIKYRIKISVYMGIVLINSNVVECLIEYVLLFDMDCCSIICNVWIKVV